MSATIPKDTEDFQALATAMGNDADDTRKLALDGGVLSTGGDAVVPVVTLHAEALAAAEDAEEAKDAAEAALSGAVAPADVATLGRVRVGDGVEADWDGRLRASGSGALSTGPLPLALPLSLSRTGTAYDQRSFETVGATELVQATVDSLDVPELVTLADFAPRGVDADGGVVGYRTSDGTLRKTLDGGTTFELVTVTGLAAANLTWLWVDGLGNRYARSGQAIYRAPAGSWAFALAFTFQDTGYATYFCFGAYLGRVIFTSYGESLSGVNNREIQTSVDGGVTWTKSLVQYDQKHMHGAVAHPNGNFYAVVGEVKLSGTPDWRGILKSTDDGATWTEITYNDGTYTNGVQPLQGIVVGDYIVWGRDSLPTGWLVHDTLTDEITPVFNSQGQGTTPTSAGFLYSMALSQGVVYAAAEMGTVTPNGGGGLSALSVRDLLSPRALLLRSGATTGWIGQWMIGPDASGHVYNFSAGGTGCLVMATRGARRRGAFYVNEGVTEVAQEVWDGHAAVIEEEVAGLPIVRVTGASSVASTSSGIAVTPGAVLDFTFAIRRGDHATTNNLLLVVAQTFDGSFVRLSNLNVYPSGIPDDGEFHVVRVPAWQVPADVNAIGLAFQEFPNTGAYHDIVGRVLVSESGPLDTPFTGGGVWTDEVTAGVSFSAHTLLTDRVYVTGNRNDVPLSTDHPLLSVDTDTVALEVGLAKLADGSTVVYVDDDGTRTEEAVEWFGGSIDPRLARARRSGSRLERQAMTPAPIVIAVSRGSVEVSAPTTGELVTVALAAPLAGASVVQFHGPAWHSPAAYEALPTEREETMRRA